MNKKYISHESRIFELQDEIGHGSYGRVFRAKDEEGRLACVKMLPLDSQHGLPCYVELALMHSLFHPHLNSSFLPPAIQTAHVYVFQDLALGDMQRHLRKKYPRGLLGAQQEVLLQSWCHQLTQALACLHKFNIVHGDIKLANVLLFPNDHLKLCDYTLSFQTLPETRYEHTICTITYRPLEALGPYFADVKGWHLPVDIWSLGVLFYALAYGQSFIDYSFGGSTETSELRSDIADQIILYSQSTGQVPHFDAPRPASPIKTTHRFFAQENDSPTCGHFKRCLFSMMQCHPNQRPTSSQLLACDYFKGLVCAPMTHRKVKQLDSSYVDMHELQSILEFSPHAQNKAMLSLIQKLVIQASAVALPFRELVLACYRIACKCIGLYPLPAKQWLGSHEHEVYVVKFLRFVLPL